MGGAAEALQDKHNLFNDIVMSSNAMVAQKLYVAHVDFSASNSADSMCKRKFSDFLGMRPYGASSDVAIRRRSLKLWSSHDRLKRRP